MTIRYDLNPTYGSSISGIGNKLNSALNTPFRDRFNSNSSYMGNSGLGSASNSISGFGNAANQNLSSNQNPSWGRVTANQSSNQTPYGGGLVNTGDGGGSFDPDSPTPGYSSPTGNYPEPSWPDPGGAETPTYPTPSPTTPTTIPPIYSPNTPSPSGGLPPVEIISQSWTPPAWPPFIPPAMPEIDFPEYEPIQLKDAGPLGFYSVNEGAAGWDGKGGNTTELDRFVADKIGGPTPIRFRDSFG